MSQTAVMNRPSLKDDVNAVLNLIEAFGSLLARETAAVKEADFATVDSLQLEKRTLAKAYHDRITALAERRAEMAALDKPLQEKLIRARTGFTITLNNNLQALEAAKDSARRLANRILDVARRAVAAECQTGYSAKGQTQSYKTSTLSLSLDHQL